MGHPGQRDHGGGLDAAIRRYGGSRSDWLDLSTGINPVPYPIGSFSSDAWTALPDSKAVQELENAARAFWQVPAGADILAAPGASALIARIPAALPKGRVCIPSPTYNEHKAAFDRAGWAQADQGADTLVVVHPNNPDGKCWHVEDLSEPQHVIIDESFCDVMPDQSLIQEAEKPGRIILKSFGKFWGLAGLRLGFAMGDVSLIQALKEELGPWAVSGPALEIGARTLQDTGWANRTRARLRTDANRMDQLLSNAGATPIGGTDLFRLYEVNNAAAWQSRLAQNHIWSRIFPYSQTWLRLGLPHPDRWSQLEAAL